MTKAEAIAMLKRIQEPEAWEPQINQAAFEALDMAIEALSQESSEDVISRNAAIDAVMRNACNTQRIYEAIKGLPSAQPEITHCRDCKWHNGETNQCNAQICASMYGEDFCSKGERREG